MRGRGCHKLNGTIINLSTPAGRVSFMSTLESGLYDGVTPEGEPIVVLRQVGSGMTFKVRHNAKPTWWGVTDYDEDGNIESTTYEPVEEK